MAENIETSNNLSSYGDHGAIALFDLSDGLDPIVMQKLNNNFSVMASTFETQMTVLENEVSELEDRVSDLEDEINALQP